MQLLPHLSPRALRALREILAHEVLDRLDTVSAAVSSPDLFKTSKESVDALFAAVAEINNLLPADDESADPDDAAVGSAFAGSATIALNPLGSFRNPIDDTPAEYSEEIAQTLMKASGREFAWVVARGPTYGPPFLVHATLEGPRARYCGDIRSEEMARRTFASYPPGVIGGLPAPRGGAS